MNIFGHITWDPRRGNVADHVPVADLDQLDEIVARRFATEIRTADDDRARLCPVIPIERLRQARDARLRREARGIGRRPIGGDAA